MKLKISNLNRLIEKLSGREIDLFLYLAKLQNEYGQVNGINYRDTTLALQMPKSTFYSALKELEDNEFIHINWGSSYGEYDIIILDNILASEKNYKEGYLKLDLDLILSEMFHLLSDYEWTPLSPVLYVQESLQLWLVYHPVL